MKSLEKRLKWQGMTFLMDKHCIRCDDTFDPISSRRVICYECNRAQIKDTLRHRAHWAVSNAVKKGFLKPAQDFRCMDCGSAAVCYEHRNYYKPLDVDPVCKKCDINRGMGYPPPLNKYGQRINIINNLEALA